MKKLFLSSLFAGYELHVIDQEDVDRSVSLAENLGLIIAITNCIDEFVHEPLQREIGNLQLGIRLLDCVARGLDKMGLAQSDTPVKIKGVVCLPGRFGDRQRRGMGKPVARCHNETPECVFLVQRCGGNVRGLWFLDWLSTLALFLSRVTIRGVNRFAAQIQSRSHSCALGCSPFDSATFEF